MHRGAGRPSPSDGAPASGRTTRAGVRASDNRHAVEEEIPNSVRPDCIKPSLLRYEKFFAADHGSNYTKKIEGQVPPIPFLKHLPWTNYKYKTSGTEGQGLYVDGGFTGNVADVTYAMAISRDHSEGLPH